MDRINVEMETLPVIIFRNTSEEGEDNIHVFVCENVHVQYEQVIRLKGFKHIQIIEISGARVFFDQKRLMEEQMIDDLATDPNKF